MDDPEGAGKNFIGFEPVVPSLSLSEACFFIYLFIFEVNIVHSSVEEMNTNMHLDQTAKQRRENLTEMGCDVVL